MKYLLCFLALGLLNPTSLFAQTSTQPVESVAHVYVYRPHNKLLGNAMHPTLSCDYDVIAKVPNGSSFEVDIPPGKYHMHAVDRSWQADDWMTLVAGHNYYLRLALAGTSGKVLTGRQVGLQLIEVPESEAKLEMANLKVLSPDKITPPAVQASGPAAQRVAFAKEMEDNGLRAGQDMSVVASGPNKTYLSVYMYVNKSILFKIGEDQPSLDKIKQAGFVQFTVADPSLRGYNPMGSAIGSALTGKDYTPSCNVAEECSRTWYF